MKTSKIAIIILVILCLLLSLMMAIKLRCKCDEPGTMSEGTAIHLKAQNDSLEKINQALDQLLGQYLVRSDSLRGKLLNITHTIQQLKQKQHESITRLDSLNSSELYGYFSEFTP